MFHEGKRSPRSSRGRPNWLNPATGLDPARSGRNRKSWRRIATAFPGGSPGRRTSPLAAAVGAVDPVVQAPRQAVHAELLVPLAEAGQNHAALVGPAVAVAVLEEKRSCAAVTSTPPFQGRTPFG